MITRELPIREHQHDSELRLERVTLEPTPAAAARARSRWARAVTAGLVVALVTAGFAVVRASVGSPGSAVVRSVTLGPAGAAGRERSLDPYFGVATWIDVFDYSPDRGGDGRPPVTPGDVGVLGALGARTVFFQAASPSGPVADVIDRDLAGEFLREAHAAGLRVVAWYTPTFIGVDDDLARLIAIHRFESGGHRFDGLAVDIESTGEPDHTLRTHRLLELSARLRLEVGDDTLGAIVLPPVLLDDVNPALWPDFPWAELTEIYDVFLPMAYWTLRSEAALRDPFFYAAENVERLRDLTRTDVPIHLIGGVGDRAQEFDFGAFAAAVQEVHPTGASVYDFRTTSNVGWSALRGLTGSRVWDTAGVTD